MSDDQPDGASGRWWHSPTVRRIAEQATGSAIGTLVAAIIIAVGADAFGLITALSAKQVAIAVFAVFILGIVAILTIDTIRWDPSPEERELLLAQLQAETEAEKRYASMLWERMAAREAGDQEE